MHGGICWLHSSSISGPSHGDKFGKTDFMVNPYSAEFLKIY